MATDRGIPLANTRYASLSKVGIYTDEGRRGTSGTGRTESSALQCGVRNNYLDSVQRGI